MPGAHGVCVPRRTSTNVWATAVPTADASGYEQIGRAEQGADAHRVKVTFSTPYADWKDVSNPLPSTAGTGSRTTGSRTGR
ncbi:hypothetical protein [Streptomyces prunicolor]|uniref:hypothetical protein n=1 Tax=Streptomyces prunicolor TaxID=67348 RepID=UPI0034490550